MNVDSIEPTQEEIVTLKGNYVIALLSGKGFVFRVERSEGSWRMLSEEIDWVARLNASPPAAGTYRSFEDKG